MTWFHNNMFLLFYLTTKDSFKTTQR